MRTRRLPSPPAGLSDHVSRREAARLLGFDSEFPIRQLEKAGRLRAVRGAMRQAWYPRAEVMALGSSLPNPSSVARAGRPHETTHETTRETTGDRGPTSGTAEGAHWVGRGPWTDRALIALLREGVPDGEGAMVRPRTVVDLVADTGTSITRARRVYRFWLAHDVHPTAALARGLGPSLNPGPPSPPPAVAPANVPVAPVEAAAALPGTSGERRGTPRIERDGLIRKLRDPDPTVRALAFEKLRPARKP